MPSTLDVTQKINSLTNIQKVTGAMNMIASLRFRKLAARQRALERFEDELNGWLAVTLPALTREGAPLISAHPQPSVRLAVVFTSDRGLCGSHNHSVHRALDRWVNNAPANGPKAEVVCLGSKGAAYARRRGYAVARAVELKGLASTSLGSLAEDIARRFLGGAAETVFIYNRYVSTLHQVTQTQVVLPLERWTGPRGAEPAFDPDLEHFAEATGVRVLRFLLAVALAHSQVSEQAARMTAMDNASKNARDLTKQAVKERNRVRQAGITGELIEIISGKEAMKR
jgi:F-type H+-transporting ATPase subunit gamma